MRELHLDEALGTPSSMKLALLPLVAFLLTDTYETPSSKPQPPRPISKIHRTPVHRFTLLRNDPGVAFDTQTGQVCRTWGWVPGGKPATADPESGNTPQRTFGEFSPTCLELYKQYESGSDDGAVIPTEDTEQSSK